MSLKVRQVIGKKIVTVSASATVQEVAGLMKRDGVGSLLVTDGKNPMGIVTETDIVQKAVAEDLDLHAAKAESIMSFPILTIDAEESVRTAAEMMVQNGIRHLAVTENDQVIGMISMRDLLHSLNIFQKKSGPQ